MVVGSYCHILCKRAKSKVSVCLCFNVSGSFHFKPRGDACKSRCHDRGPGLGTLGAHQC